MRQLHKSVSEIIKILQSTPTPGNEAKTIWEDLREQSEQAGTWDPDLMKIIEEKILKHLSSINENDLRLMWESTEAGLESFDERNNIPMEKINTDLVNESINLVMDKLAAAGNFDDDITSAEFLDDDFEDEFGIENPGGIDDNF
ncbi:hypothetical protein ACFLTH_11575 [Bacteroidota bacterium]